MSCVSTLATGKITQAQKYVQKLYNVHLQNMMQSCREINCCHLVLFLALSPGHSVLYFVQKGMIFVSKILCYTLRPLYTIMININEIIFIRKQ